MKPSRQAFERGLQAEAQALAYLQQLGFQLVQQRYRNAFGEIDLIVANNKELRFVEVKARRTLESGLYALTPIQLSRIWRCAEGFVAEYPDYLHTDRQIDLIAIAGSLLQHEPNIVLNE